MTWFRVYRNEVWGPEARRLKKVLRLLGRAVIVLGLAGLVTSAFDRDIARTVWLAATVVIAVALPIYMIVGRDGWWIGLDFGGRVSIPDRIAVIVGITGVVVVLAYLGYLRFSSPVSGYEMLIGLGLVAAWWFFMSLVHQSD